MTTHNTHFRTCGAVVAIVASLAIVALSPLGLAAQEEDRESGFYLGVKFIGSSLHIDVDSSSTFFIKDDGGGLQLHAGYSFNRVFSMEFSFGGATHETSIQTIDAAFGVAQLLFHYRFSPGKAFRPYVKGGLGGYALSVSDPNATARIEGGGVPVGGGFDYFFSKHFSLGVDLTHNIVNYNTASLTLGGVTVASEIDEAGSMTSIGLGLAYYF